MPTNNEPKRVHLRVQLEPELEAMAALWTPAKRLEMAKIYARWARQLKISAKILGAEKRCPVRKELKPLHPRRTALN
jgi:hypothetical protein